MAFPSAQRASDDALFTKPFQANDFVCGQVHVPRSEDVSFLFRVDPNPGNSPVIIVQSAMQPNWNYAFQNANYLLAAPPEVKLFEPCFAKGQRLRFRLAANPTRKIKTIPKEEWKKMSEEEKKKAGTRHGKRVPVPSSHKIDEWRKSNPDADPHGFINAELTKWLTNWKPGTSRENGKSGFSIVEPERIVVQPGFIYLSKDGLGQRIRSVVFDGILEVITPDAFRQTLICGIGSAKGFGFGLLSVAPLGR